MKKLASGVGCDAPERFCQSTRTTIHCPSEVNVAHLVERIARSFSQSGAFGRAADDVFFLDPVQLTESSHSRVVDLLSATGNALRRLGCHVINTGAAVANRIWGSS